RGKPLGVAPSIYACGGYCQDGDPGNFERQSASLRQLRQAHQQTRPVPAMQLKTSSAMANFLRDRAGYAAFGRPFQCSSLHNMNRRAELDPSIDLWRNLGWHADASVRSGIARQDSDVHTDPFVSQSHKIEHWCTFIMGPAGSRVDSRT